MATKKSAEKKGRGKNAGGVMGSKAALLGEKPHGVPAKGKGAKGKPGKGGAVTTIVRDGKPQFSDGQIVKQFLAPEEQAEKLRSEALSLRDRIMPIYLKQGKLLAQLKSLTKHGDWMFWVEDELKITPSWAATLMKIGREFDEVPKLPPGTNLTVHMLADAAAAKRAGASEKEAVEKAAEKSDGKKKERAKKKAAEPVLLGDLSMLYVIKPVFSIVVG